MAAALVVMQDLLYIMENAVFLRHLIVVLNLIRMEVVLNVEKVVISVKELV